MINAFKQIRLTNTDLVASGNRIIIAGQTGALLSDIGSLSLTNLSTSGNVEATGSALQGQVNTLTTNLRTTGSNLDGKINTLSGYTNTTFQTIANVALTGSNLFNKINTFSGNQMSFVTGILPTGLDNYFIKFPLDFPSIPRVLATVEISGSSQVMYQVNISNRVTSGFNAIFSDIISESGVQLNTYATINN